MLDMYLMRAGAAVLLGALGSTDAAFAFRPISIEELQSGRFAVPESTDIREDVAAEQIVVEFIESLAAEREARAKTQAADDTQAADSKRRNLELMNACLSLCEKTTNTEAGLTSLLLIGVVAIRSPACTAESCALIQKELERMRTRFPDRWQSTLAALVEAQLLYSKRTPGSERERKLKAIALLSRNLPAKDAMIPHDNRQVKALLRFHGYKMPPRAAYFRMIGNIQYTLATMTSRDRTRPLDVEYLDAVGITCKTILAEFPEGPHAEWARDVLDKRLPLLRQIAAKYG